MHDVLRWGVAPLGPLPLHLLPAFELVAKHGSMKRAAAVLHVTPSAVSQQISALEEALGVRLFHRKTRALALTPVGTELATLVTRTLGTLRAETARVLRDHGSLPLRLSADPFIAHEVLIPRLHTLDAMRPRLDVRLETSAELVSLERDGLDAAVRFGVGPWRGTKSFPIVDVEATIVCAPTVAAGSALPRMLARGPLIRLRDHPDPWPSIAVMLGVRLPDERLVLDTYFACVRAAESGHGFAIGLFPVSAEAVRKGRLVTPLALRVQLRAGYHLVVRREDASHPRIDALRTWVAACFAELPAQDRAGVRVIDEPL